MIVYRCALEEHIPNTLSGEGAFRHGGRWNSKGAAVIYTAEGRIMALLEVLIRQPIDKITSDFRIVPIHIPDSFFTPVLPDNWKNEEQVTQSPGDNWLKDMNNLIIKVPSALFNKSFNFLINPHSNRIKEVKLGKPEFIIMDERLMKVMRGK